MAVGEDPVLEHDARYMRDDLAQSLVCRVLGLPLLLGQDAHQQAVEGVGQLADFVIAPYRQRLSRQRTIAHPGQQA